MDLNCCKWDAIIQIFPDGGLCELYKCLNTKEKAKEALVKLGKVVKGVSLKISKENTKIMTQTKRKTPITLKTIRNDQNFELSDNFYLFRHNSHKGQQRNRQNQQADRSC